MERLYKKIYELYTAELNDLLIGYQYNEARLNQIIDLIALIWYLKQSSTSNKEAIKLIEQYS